MAQPKTNTKKAKKPGFFGRLKNFFQRSWAEFRKVSWPSFRTVMKDLGIVLVVVLFFFLIILGADALFSWLLSLLTSI